MTEQVLRTVIRARAEDCFRLSLSVDAHTAPMGRSKERAVAGVTEGEMTLGDSVTWQAIADTEVRVAAVKGNYEMDLSVGTWKVTSEDGKACAVGIQIVGASRQRHDLVYPTGECFTVRTPSGPPAPSAPPLR